MKRVYELEAGDVFLYLGREYTVTKVDRKIWYRLNSSRSEDSFGLKNQMKVELVNIKKQAA